MTARKTLHAYETGDDTTGMPIEPAPLERDWMEATHNRFAYRCLPMVLANQAGWLIPCPVRFTARWNGGPRTQDLRFWFPRGFRRPIVLSHFGTGIITFTIPYLFRTPKDVNLWVKGPSNAPKDGVQPLEGIVESDWSPATFTMNWQVTRPNHPIRFEKGEPICMLVPMPRHLAEELRPRRSPLRDNKKLHAEFEKWRESRLEFNESLARMDEEAVQRGWQKDYVLGVDQPRLHLRRFDEKK